MEDIAAQNTFNFLPALNNALWLQPAILLALVFMIGLIIGYFLHGRRVIGNNIHSKKMDVFDRVAKLYYEAQASIDALKGAPSASKFDDLVAEHTERLKKVSAILHKDMFTWSIVLNNATLNCIHKLGFEAYDAGAHLSKLTGDLVFKDKKAAKQLIYRQKRLAKKYQKFMLTARKDVGLGGLKPKIKRMFKV